MLTKEQRADPALASQFRQLRSAQLAAARGYLRVTEEKFAQILGVSRSCAQNWLYGRTPLTQSKAWDDAMAKLKEAGVVLTADAIARVPGTYPFLKPSRFSKA